MTDYENKQSQDFQDPAPQPAHTPSPQEERPQAEPAPPQPEAPVYQEAPGAPSAGASSPYGTGTHHLTLDPDENQDPFQGDPFRSPEPPRAPDPSQAEPNPQQPSYETTSPYGAPQYGVPQYNQTQYSGPNYQPPQYGQPTQQPYYPPQYNVPPVGYNQKSRLAAGLLGILLGCLGVHNFYLGFTSRGVVQLIVALVGGVFTCGMATIAIAIWGFVEGVLLLCASPSRMYDGNGVILRD